jgi:hypothetical protein
VNVPAEATAKTNGDGAEHVEKPLAMSATAHEAIVPSRAALEPQIVTRAERATNGNDHSTNGGNHWTTPTPKHQIIAQQLKISSEQLRLMALQLEVLRNARRPKAP